MELIGVTGHRLEAGRVFEHKRALAIQSDYCDGVARAGGLPVLLTPQDYTAAEAAEVVASLRGIVLTGGPDVAPERYGQEPVPEVYRASELQDGFEAVLLHAALEAGLPVLAICRGVQLLNVELGGTLRQHITGVEGLGDHGIPGQLGNGNEVSLTPGSLAAEVMGATTVRGMCHHHQALDSLGKGLVVTGRAADGIVEVVEHEEADSWLLGVQWHPEETAADDPANQALFDHLVAAARR